MKIEAFKIDLFDDKKRKENSINRMGRINWSTYIRTFCWFAAVDFVSVYIKKFNYWINIITIKRNFFNQYVCIMRIHYVLCRVDGIGLFGYGSWSRIDLIE